jgi:V8-like Glu-specific endopeptidase
LVPVTNDRPETDGVIIMAAAKKAARKASASPTRAAKKSAGKIAAKRTTASAGNESALRAAPNRARAGSPPNAHLDEALYVPRFDNLELTSGARGAKGATLSEAGQGYSELFESICGIADDSQPVEQYNGLLGVSRAFVDQHQSQACQVQWNTDLATRYTTPGDVNGVRWGSGTMISADLMLTCGHLFDVPTGWTVPRQNGTTTPISPTEIATNMHVNFNYQVDGAGALRAEQQFPITQLLEFRLGGLDMAICRIGGAPGSTFGWTEVSAANAAVGDMLAIIGHPLGNPKRIEAGPATTVTATRISYNDIDTLGGNSGSGILHDLTGRLVGVHTNGGCNPQGTGSNFGTSIAAIRGVSPILQALPASSSSARAADQTRFGADTPLAQDVINTVAGFDTRNFQDTSLRALDTILSQDIGTVRLQDSQNAADVIGTRFGRDTNFRLDDIATIAFADSPGTRGFDDPNNTLVETIVNPGDPTINPGVFINPAGPFVGSPGGLRPFVQAGPHIPLGPEYTDEVEQPSSLLDELAEAIAFQRAALERLEMIYSLLEAEATNG